MGANPPSDVATIAKLLAENVSLRELAAMLARTGGSGADAFLTTLYEDLVACIRELEGQAHRCQEDDEEKLTNYIAVQLRSKPYDAQCEPDSRGHVDLNVRCSRCDVNWKAEAKIHTDYGTNEKGLRQLLDRYSSGRDLEAGFLLYLRDQKNGMRVVQRWRERIDQKALCSAVRCEDSHGGIGFASVHRHAAGTEVRVTHFPVLLYYAPTDQSASDTTAKSTRRKKAK